jgi:hypothetical protein
MTGASGIPPPWSGPGPAASTAPRHPAAVAGRHAERERVRAEARLSGDAPERAERQAAPAAAPARRASTGERATGRRRCGAGGAMEHPPCAVRARAPWITSAPAGRPVAAGPDTASHHEPACPCHRIRATAATWFAGDRASGILTETRAEAHPWPSRPAAEGRMAKLNINGKVRDVQVEPSDTPLLWAIREQVGRPAPSTGCGVAQCGACSIHLNGAVVRSCVLPCRQREAHRQDRDHRGPVARPVASGAEGPGGGRRPAMRLLPVRLRSWRRQRSSRGRRKPTDQTSTARWSTSAGAAPTSASKAAVHLARTEGVTMETRETFAARSSSAPRRPAAASRWGCGCRSAPRPRRPSRRPPEPRSTPGS